MGIAYAWFGVAAHLGNTQAATEKETAAGALSGDALRKAESLSTDYVDRYGKPAGERGLRRRVEMLPGICHRGVSGGSGDWNGCGFCRRQDFLVLW